MAFVKPIVRTNTGAWTTVGNTYELVPLAPNYPPDHFIFVAVGSLDLDDPYEVPFQVPHTTRPTKKDLICEVRGGYVYPDYRMLLVKPVAIEDLCNPP
ncbi:MAG TPA: hypothetical protein ENI79_02335 [Rhodospirillales bacterium]|nr:hypothetical protein [Rhodospirillales bacterium]